MNRIVLHAAVRHASAVCVSQTSWMGTKLDVLGKSEGKDTDV